MVKHTPTTVLDRLIEFAVHDLAFSACPSYRYVQAGGEIPEKAKPGALLEKLSPEEREALKELTSDMTRNDRWPK